MYLRPGNLFKDFTIEKRNEDTTARGRVSAGYKPVPDTILRAVLADADPDERERWQQQQHPITHTITQRGTPLAGEGDRLVLGDRYLDSSVAYQGAGRELDAEEITTLSLWAVDGLLPHRTILLDVPPQTLDERRGSAGRDRLESAGLEFHEAVRREFLDLAQADPERYAVIDGTLPPEEVHDQVLAAVGEVLSLFDPTFEPLPPPRHRDEQ